MIRVPQTTAVTNITLEGTTQAVMCPACRHRPRFDCEGACGLKSLVLPSPFHKEQSALLPARVMPSLTKAAGRTAYQCPPHAKSVTWVASIGQHAENCMLTVRQRPLCMLSCSTR